MTQFNLVLLRHAHRDTHCHGPDVYLNEEGELFANNVLKYALASKFDIIFTSPYNRCIQTIYPYVNFSVQLMQYDINLSEFTENEIRASYEDIFSNISNKYKHLIGNRFQDNDVVHKEYVETIEQFNERITTFINKLKNIKKEKYDMDTNSNQKNTLSENQVNILICSHGSCIKELYKQLKGEELENIPDFGEIIVLNNILN